MSTIVLSSVVVAPMLFVVSQLTWPYAVMGKPWGLSWLGRWLQAGSRLRADRSQAPTCIGSEHLPLLEELRAGMATDTVSDALLKSAKFTLWVLGLQRRGYKLAMVKDGHVEAVHVF
jgi:hypothetical protein